MNTHINLPLHHFIKGMGIVLCSVIAFLWHITYAQIILTDIPVDHPFGPIAAEMVSRGIMNQSSDGSFRAQNTITRAESLAVSMRIAGIKIADIDDTTELPMDVIRTAWYAPYVATARRTGVISIQNTFRPDDNTTKAEALAMLMNALNINVYKHLDKTKGIALDIKSDAWYAPYFSVARRFYIAAVQDDGKYYPDKYITRLDMAVFGYRTEQLSKADRSEISSLEVSAQIQNFMNLVERGQTEKAQEYIPTILQLADEVVERNSNSDSLSVHTLSLALSDFSDALRSYQNGSTLDTLEKLHLAANKLQSVQMNSEKLIPMTRNFEKAIDGMVSSLGVGVYESIAYQS